MIRQKNSDKITASKELTHPQSFTLGLTSGFLHPDPGFLYYSVTPTIQVFVTPHFNKTR